MTQAELQHIKERLLAFCGVCSHLILLCGIIVGSLLLISVRDSQCDETKDQFTADPEALVGTWSVIIGESGYDKTQSLLQTTEGGFILIGEANSSFGAQSNQAIIVKLDGDGNRKWLQLLGDGTHANSIQQTADGGYIIVGDKLTSDYTEPYNGPFAEQNIWILKIDESGNWEWERIYGTKNFEEANLVQQTPASGFIVVGHRTNNDTVNSDVILLNTDAEGHEIWSKIYGDKGHDFPNCIRQTTEGGFILAGGSSSFGEGGMDMWVLKLDINGNQEWAKYFGGTYNDVAQAVVQTHDGGYVVAGNSQSFGAGKNDARILKIDATGKTIWTRTYGGKEDDRIYSFEPTSDGGFIAAGYTESSGAGSHDVWILKLDSSGNKEWEKVYGGKDWDDANSIQQTKDGGFILGATTMSFGAVRSADIWVIKLDSKGNCTGCF